MVGKGKIVIYPKMLIHGGPKVVWRERSFNGLFSFRVRGSNDLTGSHASARNQNAHRPRPMVASRLIYFSLRTFSNGYSGRTAELTSDDKQNLLV